VVHFVGFELKSQRDLKKPVVSVGFVGERLRGRPYLKNQTETTQVKAWNNEAE